jgi:hypothetical protein
MKKMSYMITNSAEVKETKTIIARYEAEQEVKVFIEELKEDLDTLRGESYQRHTPEFYDEVSYYNDFHKFIPQSLILSKCYLAFISLYSEQGKSLFEAISAFLEEYDEMIKGK